MRGATNQYGYGWLSIVSFQSTLLMRGATVSPSIGTHPSLFQSTLLMRGATIGLTQAVARRLFISIHAPHARSDVMCAPHARTAYQFQSTLLMRGATSSHGSASHELTFQSTLLMRGATMSRQSLDVLVKFQSTLLMRGATFWGKLSDGAFLFQSTLLMRGATRPHVSLLLSVHISIHAPHARSDKAGVARVMRPGTFQSTLLMRGATDTLPNLLSGMAFQSTLLMRGATLKTY